MKMWIDRWVYMKGRIDGEAYMNWLIYDDAYMDRS